MVESDDKYLTLREEYRLRVPRVPRQSIDVFARNIEAGDYGLSADRVDAILSYSTLQRTLNSFEDLTFSHDFLDRLPDELREKIGENLYPGIALADLEVPTTDKVLLVEMLAADRLTEALSQRLVEVWVTSKVQEDLRELGYPSDTGFQKVDYRQLSLKAKHYLVQVMERQEAQVHTMLAARQRFLEGIPPLGFAALLTSQEERTKLDSLIDLESQYKIAQQVLDNPFLVHFSEFMEKSRQRTKEEKSKTEEERGGGIDDLGEFPIDVEQEAKAEWWNYERYNYRNEPMQQVAAYLRPQYAKKTIYEILGAHTPKAQQEVLAAFWRTGLSRHIDLGDEPWMRNNLYLKTDGTLHLQFSDEVYGDNDDLEESEVTGPLTSDRSVAMVDQAVKWIREEMSAMETVRAQWERNGFDPNPTIEVTLATALDFDRNAELLEEIQGLPKWFKTALSQELKYYDQLIEYRPKMNMDDLISELFSMEPEKPQTRQNMLKAYFNRANARLERDRRLISNPEELYKDLDLELSANPDEVRRAYRKIAQETRAIHISSPDEFDPEEWQAMNTRFINATRAYTAISSRKLGENRVTTLGRISAYFKEI